MALKTLTVPEGRPNQFILLELAFTGITVSKIAFRDLVIAQWISVYSDTVKKTA